MIPNGKGWHYLAVKKLSALLRWITSKHHCDFYCVNFLHSFGIESEPDSYRKECENRHFCNVLIPSKDTKILEFNQNKKFSPFIIYTDIECLIEKIYGYKNNSQNPSTMKVINFL